MQNDKYAMAEKILSEIYAVFEKDKELAEFDIIPMHVNQNKSPVLHSDHCMGIESWCVKHVYCYAYRTIMDSRLNKNNIKHDDRFIKTLNGAVLLNPDVPSLWNVRRELILKKVLTLQDELKISRLVLSRKHKCNEAFAYRRWIIMQDNTLSERIKEDFIATELKLTELCADRSPTNIHAWSHRMWVVTAYTKDELFTRRRPVVYTNFLLRELEFIEHWIETHVSDYSGFHYRQFLLNNIRKNLLKLDDSILYTSDYHVKCYDCLRRLFSCKNNETIDFSKQNSAEEFLLELFAREYKHTSVPAKIIVTSVAILVYELDLCTELASLYHNHESIWHHRRYCICSLIEINRLFYTDYKIKETFLNDAFKQQNTDLNIIACLNSGLEKDLYTGEKNPKILKIELDVGSPLLRALRNNERKFSHDLKYYLWCQIVLGFDYIN